jgi:hypothetical protein
MDMKTVKTKNGTELPLLDLKGKDYLQVAYRIVWFREENPKAQIQTDFIQLSENHAIAKATILDQNGSLLATAHKLETSSGFPDYIEKAETGAIGRALGLVGYGTQFTNDLDEGGRLADSPLTAKTIPGGNRALSPIPTVSPNHAKTPPKAQGSTSGAVPSVSPPQAVKPAVKTSVNPGPGLAGEAEAAHIKKLAEMNGWSHQRVSDFIQSQFAPAVKVSHLTLPQYQDLAAEIAMSESGGFENDSQGGFGRL